MATVLTSVDALARYVDVLGALPHVKRQVSEYLDATPRWTRAQAARYGHVRLLQRLVDSGSGGSNGERDWEDVLTAAVTNNHAQVVRWVLAKKPTVSRNEALEIAAAHGHLDIVVLLHDHATATRSTDTAWTGRRRRSSTALLMDEAAANGHLEVVQWLHTHGLGACTSDAMDRAAARGFFNVVEWLHDNRMEGCTTVAMDMAAQNGFLDVVEFLHENRPEGCSASAMDGAAAGGHMALLEYLHENRDEGCTPDAMCGAAAAGHFEVVQWLYSHCRNMSVLTKAIRRARSSRHHTIVAWLERKTAEEQRPHESPVQTDTALMESTIEAFAARFKPLQTLLMVVRSIVSLSTFYED